MFDSPLCSLCFCVCNPWRLLKFESTKCCGFGFKAGRIGSVMYDCEQVLHKGNNMFDKWSYTDLLIMHTN